MVIHGYTVAIISNGTFHPLDPFLSIHLLKQCNHRPVGCFCKSAQRSDRGSHTELHLNRIYAPNHLQRGGVPKMSNNNNNHTNSTVEISDHVYRQGPWGQVKTDLHFPISNECAEIMTNWKREHAKWEKEKGRGRIGARQRQRN